MTNSLSPISSYSLSELLAAVHDVLCETFSSRVWVRAEVSSLSARPGSHCYMEFAEKGEDRQQFAAKVRANCWRNDWIPISALFEAVTGMELSVGMQVLAEVSVDFHEVYGLSLTVHRIDPTYTLGDLARQKEETLRRLREEGVFDMQQSLSLPTLPHSLAVISSGSAAGYQDFCHQLQNNAYGFRFETTLFEAVMQGDSAPASIVSALQEVFQHPFDAVVIIRGGGATTDLSCFDNYELASHCAQFPLPIIAGIGHTRDVSIVDQVAFASFKTPTAVAEFFISLLADQLTLLDDLSIRLSRTADQQVLLRRTAVERLQMRLQLAFQNRLQAQLSQLDLMEKTITLHSPEWILQKGYTITTVNGSVVRFPTQLSSGDRIRTEFASGSVDSIVL